MTWVVKKKINWHNKHWKKVTKYQSNRADTKRNCIVDKNNMADLTALLLTAEFNRQFQIITFCRHWTQTEWKKETTSDDSLSIWRQMGLWLTLTTKKINWKYFFQTENPMDTYRLDKTNLWQSVEFYSAKTLKSRPDGKILWVIKKYVTYNIYQLWWKDIDVITPNGKCRNLCSIQ